MVNIVEQSINNLNDCGCCEGLSVQTPVEIVNQPGLAAIAYRVGSHSQFKHSMLASLSDAQQPQLAGLKTRSDDDFAIALLDAWAVVADILTFYQERIANEAYLRTATERRSVLELARSIGYELRPGVAASTYLAFTIEDAQGAPKKTTIDTGARVQSIPNPGEKAQTFETIASIPARSAWNAMKPRLTTRHPFKKNGNLLTTFYFDGISTNLRLGDGLIIVPDDDKKPVFCLVTAVTAQPSLQRTQVDVQVVSNTSPILLFKDLAFLLNPIALAQSAITSQFFSPIGAIYAASAPLPPGSALTSKLSSQIGAVDLYAASSIENFALVDIFANIAATQAPPPGVLAFRTRASIFGHNAPKWETLPYNLTHFEYIYTTNTKPIKYELVAEPYQGRKDTWAEVTLDKYPPDPSSDTVYLDTTYQTITPNSYVVLRDGDQGTWGLHQVFQTSDLSVADFTLSAKVTRLTLDNGNDFGSFGIRATSVFGQSEQLLLARLPITDPVMGTAFDLDGLIDGLYIGQGLMVCGELSTDIGNQACEYVTLHSIQYNSDDGGHTSITLDGTGLANIYVRNTVTINGNVAPATHGETKQEVLGSGDGSQPYQKFMLRQSPLTYISAATASGTQSSLKLYVNDMLWHEVPAFYGHGPTERIYITRTSDDAKTTTQSGDGLTGARLPSSQENVRVVYRTGIGLAGLVKAGQLTQLLTRPGGVKGVTNPQDTSGAADPEMLDDARQNAPLPVLTLDRIVSLRDYEDFARAFAGIAKALATWTWDGQRRGVFVTVAGPQGAAIESGSPLYTNLISAMQQAGDPFVPLQVRSYVKRFFRIAAIVTINPDYVADRVAAAIEAALRTAFSFAVRAFGQPVTLSEVIAAMQAVAGVLAVDVTVLYRSYPIAQEAAVLNFALPASVPLAGGGVNVSAAELLILDPGPIDLTISV